MYGSQKVKVRHTSNPNWHKDEKVRVTTRQTINLLNQKPKQPLRGYVLLPPTAQRSLSSEVPSSSSLSLSAPPPAPFSLTQDCQSPPSYPLQCKQWGPLDFLMVFRIELGSCMSGTPPPWAILATSWVPTPLSYNFLRRSTVNCLLVNLQLVKYTCLILFPASIGSAASLARYSILEVILTNILLCLFSLLLGPMPPSGRRT